MRFFATSALHCTTTAPIVQLLGAKLSILRNRYQDWTRRGVNSIAVLNFCSMSSSPIP